MTTGEFLSNLRRSGVRLWAEGNRLRYSAPPGTMTPEVLEQLAERKADLLDFLRAAGVTVEMPARPILPVARDRTLPLSYAQLRLWIFDRLAPNSPVYNISGAVRLRGVLDVSALEQTFAEVIRRHEVLHTTFVADGDTPAQVIAPPRPMEIPAHDLRLLPQSERECEAQRRATEEAHRPFDLAKGPLLRVLLLRMADAEHILLLTMHHIVSDGWSMGILIGEVAVLYEAYVKGHASPLPPLPIQYADFADWQRAWLQGEVLEKQLAYWKRQLGDLPVLELPTDHPRPAVQTFRGATRTAALSQTLVVELRRLCRREGVTLYMALLAAFAILLQRYTGQEDIPVGTTVANRNRAEIEGLIGFFVNTLVLRADLSGDPTLPELLRRVREVSLDAYVHQDIPFEKLVEELQPKRDMSRTPLFQVMFVLQNAPASAQRLEGLEVSPFPLENRTAKFDLTLTVEEASSGLSAALEYNADIFDDATITRLLGHFQTLLAGMVAEPHRRISELPLLTDVERRQLLTGWNQARADYPADAPLHQLFEAQVARTPDAVALVHEGEQLTYRELNTRANRLAHRLQALGVGSEVLVGVLMERGFDLVVALLGVLKSGGAYLPLDPSSPPERLDFIVNDARVKVLLTEGELGAEWQARETEALVFRLDADGEQLFQESAANPSSGTLPENLAYVIYTSGSTGRPKGTLVSHHNVVRLFRATQPWFNFNERDVWTLFHSYAFDFSVWELWGALLFGGRLVVVPFLVSRAPQTFYDLLCREGVTVLNQTPSAFRQLLQADEATASGCRLALRLIIFGGEALELQSLKPWLDRHGDEHPRLINMYGITETTVHVTYRHITSVDIEINPKSFVGCSIPDLQLYVLDRHRQPVPVGVPGELCVGGAGLARGYLRRADLTAEKFIPHPFATEPGMRLYLSGDRVRYLPDGDIEYLGRLDQQIKIRGFRIELDEIALALEQHEAVREAVVLAKEQAGVEKRLVAYLVPRRGQALTVTELRNFLKTKLPDYMVPSAFVMLAEMPLTANGKINRAALPEPDTARPELEKVFVAPGNWVEQRLAAIWQEVLGVDRVGVHDNFFELGGDSIRSIQVQARAQAAGISFSIQQLFRHHTIEELAQVASVPDANGNPAPEAKTEPFGLVSAADRARLPSTVEDAYPLAMLQAGMLFHSQYNPDSAVYHNISSVHLRAPFDLHRLQAAVESLLRRHPVLRTSFDLINYSEPLQLVHRDAPTSIAVTEISHLPAAEQDRLIDAWMEEEKKRKFDWSRAPLLRFRVHLRGENSFQFSWSDHHAILDGWSVASMITELFRFYFSSLGMGIAPPGPPPDATFRDFVALEREALESEQGRDFWMQKLGNGTATVLPRWPLSRRAREVRQETARVPIAGDLSDGLKALSRSLGVPLKSVLLAAHMRVMSLLSGQADVMTGLVFNGRPEESGGERVYGLFLNTLPVRVPLGGGTWADLVRAVFEAEHEIMPYRRYPLANLQRLLGGKPLFETTFNFVNFHVYNELAGLPGVELLSERSFADTNYAFKAAFSLDLATSGVQLEFGYLISELAAEQVQLIGGYYLRALGAMVADPSSSYRDAVLLSPEELREHLVEWNDTRADYARDATLPQLFEAQVERTPDAFAVSYEGEQLTFRELNASANRLAHRLRALGVGPDVPVCLMLGRSLELIVGVLGVLKAGGAYVPLEPDYPPERLAFMIEETAAPVLLTKEHLAANLPTHRARVVYLDRDREQLAREDCRNPVGLVAPRNLAYVIFTSGSTGRPKGVLVEQQSAINYAQAMIRRLRLRAGHSFAMVQPLTVDSSVTALYLPLLSGGCVHVINH